MQEWLETHIAPALNALLDPLHQFLNGLPPPVWRGTVCTFLILGTCWALFLTRGYIYQGAPTAARWRDLRLWIPLLLLPYLIIYLTF